MRFSMRIKSEFLRFCLAAIPLFICSRPFAAMTANFDTAWTFTYDGGVSKNGIPISDRLIDIKILQNGDAICAGRTSDSGSRAGLILQLTPNGKVHKKGILVLKEGFGGASLLIAKNGDLFVGGIAFGEPELLRLDSQFNIKSAFWYYDSINSRSKLLHGAILQSLVQTSDGRIIAVGGDEFPYGNGSPLNNYAVWMEFDSLGALNGRVREWSDSPGFEIAGWSLLETASGGFLLGGNQATGIITNVGDRAGLYKYTFSLKGVGTEINQVSRVRKLRDGKLIVVGQAYEEDCWTKYQRLSYDAWWSFISETGSNDSWNVAGLSGSDDALYDVTQLTDNRLAFLGLKGTVPDSGLWVFVTDSTGKTLQWERQFNLPGTDGITTSNNMDPYTIAATPDSGFIVVGKENTTEQGENAFAIKFVPKAMSVSQIQFPRTIEVLKRFDTNTFTFEACEPGKVELRLFDIKGQLIQHEIKHHNIPGSVSFKISSHAKYNQLILWELSTTTTLFQGKYLMSKRDD